MSNEERLITAVCMSSDEKCNRALQTKGRIIEKWTKIPKRGRWNRRKKMDSVESIMQAAIATKESLEKRLKSKIPNRDMKSFGVKGLINYCDQTIFLCEEINKLKGQLEKVKKMLK